MAWILLLFKFLQKMNKIYTLYSMVTMRFSKIYGLPELGEGILWKIYGLPELAEGILWKIYGLPELAEGIFSKLFTSFWVIQGERFVNRNLQQPIWEISSNIIPKIKFSDFALLKLLRLLKTNLKQFLSQCKNCAIVGNVRFFVTTNLSII